MEPYRGLTPSKYDKEISFLDALRFFKSAYKIVAISGLVGLATSIAYLVITPKKFEAVAQITMARVIDFKDAKITNRHLFANIEEPSMLIVRLTQPTSITPQIIQACKADQATNQGLTVVKSMKLKQVKELESLVELRIIAASPHDAESCILAIFEFIKTTQAQMIAPYTEELKTLLLNYEERLVKAKEFIAKADKASSTMGGVYLSTRDEILFLLDEIASIRYKLAIIQREATQLIAPIYVSPIELRRDAVLFSGLLGGIFLGLLIALARLVIAKLTITLVEVENDQVTQKSGSNSVRD